MARVGARMQEELDDEVFRASVRAARERDAGRRRLHALRDLEYLQQLFSGTALMAVLDLPWSPLFFLTIFLFHWQLGVLAAAGAAVLVVLAAVNGARSRKPSQAARARATEAEGFERTVRSGAEAAEALGMMTAAAGRWRARRSPALAAQIAAADITGAYASATRAIRFLLQSAILAWGAWLAIGQAITPGMIIAASIMAGRALAPIDQAIGQWRSYARGRLAWWNLSALFDDRGSTPAPTALPPLDGHVKARGLAVAPPGADAPILRGLAFSVAPGQALGAIGPTGSGKSALARPLVGLWPPARGSLTLDGAALDQWLPEALDAQIGYLPQDVSLFDATVAENIARLQTSYDDAAVVAAAKRARAHELILALPSGYDTMVGPSGAALSGGQRQRIGLARAVFGDPALVVLDEPNAHLDADGEKAVIDVIGGLKAAHRSVVVMAQWPARRFSAVAAMALVGGVGGWAALAELAGAVIAPGEVRAASNRQVVQHCFGGTVAAILARDGDVVAADQVLLRLNDTRLTAERAILQRRLDESRARRARLSAGRDGETAISFDRDLLTRAERDAELADMLSGQARFFAARADAHLEARAQLANRISQIEDEIAGFENQIAAANPQRAIVLPEIEALRGLYEQGLARRTTLAELRLEAARIDRDLALFGSEIAGARSRIGENEIALSRLDAERREEVIAELRELDVEVLDIQDELSKVDDELSGIEIAAPVAGIVHDSTVHTRGAVIRPADPILAVVPSAERLIVEARVAPESIDRVRRGQEAMVRFSAFNARTTPELAGAVERVSADRTIDEATGQPWFTVEIAVSARELERLDGRALIPGMPAEVFVRTAGRTPLSYLVKPLTDHMRRALREE